MSENPFRWVIPFTIIDSINRIFYGMYSTLIGPSNPYLARKLSVGIDDINLKEPFGKNSKTGAHELKSFLISRKN